MAELGKMLVLLGAVLVLVGSVLWFGGGSLKWLPLGRLPGDIAIERETFTFYFPLVTCLLLSLGFSAVIWLVRELFR